MDSENSPHNDMDVSIIDKDESSDKAYHVVGGFVIEDSKRPFPQNGQLSFVPEDYGKEKPPPVKKTRNHAHSSTPKHSRNVSPDDPPEDATCEYCKMVGPRNQFLPPSRRFCSLSCCKRYSAEKRYYPYGRDEEGIAKAIREGLVNPKSKSVRQASSKQGNAVRDQRRRKMASFEKEKGTPEGGSTSKSPRGKRSKQTSSSSGTPSQRVKADKKHKESATVEAYAHPTGVPLQSWTINDVGEFLTTLGYEAYIDRFVEHEIDGKALSLIKDYHLLMTLKLRLGPTLKICQQVNTIRATEEASDNE